MKAILARYRRHKGLRLGLERRYLRTVKPIPASWWISDAVYTAFKEGDYEMCTALFQR